MLSDDAKSIIENSDEFKQYAKQSASAFKPIVTECGNIAVFDIESGISYRCTACFAVVGSIGMPVDCRTVYEQAEMWRRLNDD